MRPEHKTLQERLSIADDHLARAEEALAKAEEAFNTLNISGYGTLIESHVRIASAYLYSIQVRSM